MGIFSLFRKAQQPENKTITPTEERARVDDPVYWQEFFSRFGITTKSNQSVTPDSALKSTTVYACVRVLAETVASLPLMVYKRLSKGGKEVWDENELYYLLHDQPNPDQTAYEFFEMIMGHLCLRGNAYSFKEINNGGEITALYPLNPAKMVPERKNKVIRYRYQHEEGKEEVFPQEMIWHIKGLATDPFAVVGLSPISLAREAIGLDLASEDHQARFLANYSRPSGILEHPGKLDPEQQKLLKETWQDTTTGENAYKVKLLSGGLKWTQIGLSNKDSQFIELRNYQVEDIARIFRVPCVLLQHADKNSTYASAEQFFLSFVTHTIRPWCSRIEQSISKDLMTARDRKRYFAEFKLEGFLRGNI